MQLTFRSRVLRPDLVLSRHPSSMRQTATSRTMELAAAARDTESEQPESKATSLVVHHVALLDKCAGCQAVVLRLHH